MFGSGRLLIVGCWLLVVRCSMFDVRCSMFDVWCLMATGESTPLEPANGGACRTVCPLTSDLSSLTGNHRPLTTDSLVRYSCGLLCRALNSDFCLATPGWILRN